jgi:hypothetical protein
VRTDSRVVYQFGPFEVNVAAGELLKSGRRIRLQDLPHRLLVAPLRPHACREPDLLLPTGKRQSRNPHAAAAPVLLQGTLTGSSRR